MAKKDTPENRKQKFINYFWVTMTAVIAICTLIVSISTLGDMMRTRNNRRSVERKIAHLEAKIARDSTFIEQITTSPEFMEQYARETYHMQRKGETVYILE
ncbi:MAG: septum formation initiator family protein [Alistipes sp.]|nr:septum formation initiator family protein [Alistipes sp.]MBQ3248045.1 septum formation initiator family protein [Alistipes sp.]MBR3826887.1 septum formation initiator family protein [Alistipes sp.]